MKHTIKELENCRIQIDVDVESDVWEEAQRKEFQRALGSVQIPGCHGRPLRQSGKSRQRRAQ